MATSLPQTAHLAANPGQGMGLDGGAVWGAGTTLTPPLTPGMGRLPGSPASAGNSNSVDKNHLLAGST